MAAGDPPQTPHDAPPDPQVGLRRLALVALAPYDSRLWGSSRIAVPKL